MSATTMDHILNAVCDVFGVEEARITSRERPASISDARLAFYLVAREKTALTTGKIGARVGRVHSTVVKGSDRAKMLVEVDREFRSKVEGVLWRVVENVNAR